MATSAAASVYGHGPSGSPPVPVTAHTIAILDAMGDTLSRELLRDAHSLPCQHHFCLKCIQGPLERSSICPTCHNQFWAKDLVVNTTINSIIDNYHAMDAWIRQKQTQMGQPPIDGRAPSHRRKKDGDDEEEDASKENPPRRAANSKHATPSPHQKEKAANATTPSSSRSTPRRSHATTPPPPSAASPSATIAAAAAASSSPSPSSKLVAHASSAFTAGPPSSSSAHTPQRVSLKDTLAATSTAVSANAVYPPSSLSFLPKPASPFHAPLSHTKNFSKQAVVKKATSPVPTSAAVAPRSSAAAKLPLPSLFDTDDEAEAAIAAVARIDSDEDEVMEVSAASFNKKDDSRKRSTANGTTPENAPSAVLPGNKQAAPAKPASAAVAKAWSTTNGPTANGTNKPNSLKQFFKDSASGQHLAKAVPLPTPPAAASPTLIDDDGDVVMPLASPAPTRSSGGSLSPKLSDPPGAPQRQASENVSLPPMPIENSLSIPHSHTGSPLRDIPDSLPPLELAPPINLYSPPLPMWPTTGHQLVESVSQMDIDPPPPPPRSPPRRSLAKELANLQAANPPPSAAAAMATPPVLPPPPPAASSSLAPLLPLPVTTGSEEHAAEPAASSISRAVSSATAVSVQLSLPMMTEVSVHMPSMGGALNSPNSQHPTRASSEAATVVMPPAPADVAAMAAAPVTPPSAPQGITLPAATPVVLAPPAAAAALAPAAQLDPLLQATLSIGGPVDNGLAPSLTPPPPASLSRSPITIAFSTVTPDEKAQLTAFASRLGSTLVSGRLWTADVTHVILKTKGGDAQRLASRSLKFMHGVLCGAWVVSWAWVTASIRAGFWVDETPFEIEGDASKGVSHAPSTMRQKLANGGDRLLKNLKFCVRSDMVAGRDPSVAEIRGLVEFGGGILIPEPSVLTKPATPGAPVASSSTSGGLLSHTGISRLPSIASTPGPIYLLMRGDAHKVYDVPSMQALGAQVGMIPLAVPWLLDSISLGRLTHVDLFRADITQEQKKVIREQQLDREQQQQVAAGQQA